MIKFEDIPADAAFMGVDPDSHNIGIVVLSAGTAPHFVLSKVGSKVKGFDCAIAHAEIFAKCDMNLEGGICSLEAQDARYSGKTNKSRPQDMVKLALVTGVIASTLTKGGANVEMVMPSTWKGSIPKDVHQRRICQAMGWEYTEKKNKSETLIIPKCDYVATVITINKPPQARVLNQGEWKHVLDSVGLALYAAEEYAKKKRIEEAVKEKSKQ